MVNFRLGKEWNVKGEMINMTCGTKNLSPWQKSNPWPPEHMAGALSTELRELKENSIPNKEVKLHVNLTQ